MYTDIAPVRLPIHFLQAIATSNLIYFTVVWIVTWQEKLSLVFLVVFSLIFVSKSSQNFIRICSCIFKSSIGRIRYAYHLYTAVFKCVRTEFRSLSKADYRYSLISMNFACIGSIINVKIISEALKPWTWPGIYGLLGALTTRSEIPTKDR